MDVQEGTTCKLILTTKGRKTGKPHFVMLRAVVYNGMIYLSRHRPDGDWFQNALAESNVQIIYKNKAIFGIAREVTDEKLLATISNIKYKGEQRAKEHRVAIEVNSKDAENILDI